MLESLFARISEILAETLGTTTQRLFHVIDALIHRHVMEYPVVGDDAAFTEFLADLVEAYLASRS